MKIILIALPQKIDIYRFEPVEIAPLALYLLASVLKESGHEVAVADPCEFMQFENQQGIDPLCAEYIVEKIKKEHGEMAAFSVNSFNWSNSKIVVEKIVACLPGVKLVLGGLHPTLFDEHVLKVSGAQIVIRGEGEKTLVNLCDTLKNGRSLETVKGITYKENGIIRRNQDEAALDETEMEKTPYPAYELLPVDNPYTQLPVETSRGCYFSCAFCSIPHRRKWRGISETEVISRTRHALKYKQNINRGNRILYVDDCFTADGERAKNIFRRLKQLYGYGQKFFIEARITDILKTDILQNIPPQMISSMQIGVECGYDEGLKKVRKGLCIEQLFQALEIIRTYHFEEHCFLSFIIGFPWETMELINRTLDTVERISSQYKVVCNLNWLLFLPSDLWKERDVYQIKVQEDMYDEVLWYGNNRYFFETHPLITEKDILEVEKRVGEMQGKGPVAYRRSIGLEENYLEPSAGRRGDKFVGNGDF